MSQSYLGKHSPSNLSYQSPRIDDRSASPAPTATETATTPSPSTETAPTVSDAGWWNRLVNSFAEQEGQKASDSARDIVLYINNFTVNEQRAPTDQEIAVYVLLRGTEHSSKVLANLGLTTSTTEESITPPSSSSSSDTQENDLFSRSEEELRKIEQEYASLPPPLFGPRRY